MECTRGRCLARRLTSSRSTAPKRGSATTWIRQNSVARCPFESNRSGMDRRSASARRAVPGNASSDSARCSCWRPTNLSAGGTIRRTSARVGEDPIERSARNRAADDVRGLPGGADDGLDRRARPSGLFIGPIVRLPQGLSWDVVDRARGRRSGRGRWRFPSTMGCSAVGRVRCFRVWLGRGGGHRDELADGIWLESLPRTWERTLSGVVTRLRAGLSEAGVRGDIISFVDGRYSLVGGGDVHVDVRDAACGLVVAREAAVRNDFEGARAGAEAVLDVFRLPLLPGEDAGWVDVARARHGAALLDALDLLADAGLRASRTCWRNTRPTRRCIANRCTRPGISVCCGF